MYLVIGSCHLVSSECCWLVATSCDAVSLELLCLVVGLVTGKLEECCAIELWGGLQTRQAVVVSMCSWQ